MHADVCQHDLIMATVSALTVESSLSDHVTEHENHNDKRVQQFLRRQIKIQLAKDGPRYPIFGPGLEQAQVQIGSTYMPPPPL